MMMSGRKKMTRMVRQQCRKKDEKGKEECRKERMRMERKSAGKKGLGWYQLDRRKKDEDVQNKDDKGDI
jgi:hypothetical protein